MMGEDLEKRLPEGMQGMKDLSWDKPEKYLRWRRNSNIKAEEKRMSLQEMWELGKREREMKVTVHKNPTSTIEP
jgi:hypothetical protein